MKEDDFKYTEQNRPTTNKRAFYFGKSRLKEGRMTSYSQAEDLSFSSFCETPDLVTAIFREHNDELCRFIARHLKSREDVNGIAQEVYLRLVRNQEHEGDKYSRAYIFQIAANLLKDRYRRKIVRLSNQHVSSSQMELTSPLQTPEEELLSKKKVKIIEAFIERLKPEPRKAFVLHRFKGLSYDQIASKMGIPKRRVKHHIHTVLIQGREKLRGIL